MARFQGWVMFFQKIQKHMLRFFRNRKSQQKEHNNQPTCLKKLLGRYAGILCFSTQTHLPQTASRIFCESSVLWSTQLRPTCLKQLLVHFTKVLCFGALLFKPTCLKTLSTKGPRREARSVNNLTKRESTHTHTYIVANAQIGTCKKGGNTII